MKNKKQERKSQYRFTTEDAEHTEERQIHFTMKNMKGVKENLGTPLSVAAFLISPLATNASPLDHARRAAGGE